MPPSAESLTFRPASGPHRLDVSRITRSGAVSSARTDSIRAAAFCRGNTPLSHGSTHFILTSGTLRAKSLEHSRG